MKIAVLTANLGNFDSLVNPVDQEFPDGVDEIAVYRFTDENFPPIIGLTPRLQYRIPKLFGWQMFPGYDVYIWLDGSMSLPRADSVKWLIEKLGESDAAFFEHPWRKTIKQEVDHIEEYLAKGNEYISSRYKNGLHNQQYEEILKDEDFVDDVLYTSTVFVYRNIPEVHSMMSLWWFHQSRYFTCDQVVLPYVVWKSEVVTKLIPENQFKIPYLSLASKHK